MLLPLTRKHILVIIHDIIFLAIFKDLQFIASHDRNAMLRSCLPIRQKFKF